MNENHINYFKVENFKRFESFEMSNIGQFNLIVGDNNVGKTSILEALAISDFASLQGFLEYLWFFMEKRGFFTSQIKPTNIQNIVQWFQNKTDSPIKISVRKTIENVESTTQTTISTKKYAKITREELEYSSIRIPFQSEELFYYFTRSNYTEVYPTKSFQHNVDYLVENFIATSDLFSESLEIAYVRDFQQSSLKKKALVEKLRLFIPNIDWIEPTNMISNQFDLLVYEKDKDKPNPLTNFGDGVNKFFRALIQAEAIIQTQTIRNKAEDIAKTFTKRLCIDEIDSGIHFSKMKDFWKVLIKTAIENDIQLFATTHNLECLEYFKQAFEELENSPKAEVRCFLMLEQLNKTVKSVCYDFDAFEWMLDAENEIRG
jgi:AAA15 family ATPase/GTPase